MHLKALENQKQRKSPNTQIRAEIHETEVEEKRMNIKKNSDSLRTAVRLTNF